MSDYFEPQGWYEGITPDEAKFLDMVDRFMEHDCGSPAGDACQACEHIVNSLKIKNKYE